MPSSAALSTGALPAGLIFPSPIPLLPLKEGTEPEPLMSLPPTLLEPLALSLGGQGTKPGVLHCWARASRDSRMRRERWGRRQGRCIIGLTDTT